MIRFLTTDEVLHIHDRVCVDLSVADGDPVDTPGARDVGLLESAVARQEIGARNVLKYDTPYLNAATLMFGLCCNHPFHNGNKRTALVSMIAHLEKNGYTLFETKQQALYSMVKDVARHRLADSSSKKRGSAPIEASKRDADSEVDAIARWLRGTARRTDKAERRITHRQLRTILSQYGFDLRDPKNGSIAVCREVVRRKGLALKRVTEYDRVCSIAYRGETRLVGMRDLKKLRRESKLDDRNGYDSEVFYGADDPVDVWINDYRSVLEKLSKE
jgi:death-on-curing family protein